MVSASIRSEAIAMFMKFGFTYGSNTCKIHCWTILSHIVGIPNGLTFPFAFGMKTRLTLIGLVFLKHILNVFNYRFNR